MTVVIIGGGVVGLATAYFLADRGTEVTLLERNALGSGSTERANGGIRAQFTTPSNIQLSLTSLNVWESFDAQFDAELDFRQNGYLFLTGDDDRATQFHENVKIQQDHGVPSEYLDREEVEEITDLDPDANVVAGTYCPLDGYADPHGAVRGFADAAGAAGAVIRTNTPAESIEPRGDGYGVQAMDEWIQAEHIVIAAGVWSPELADELGIDLPISPVRRQLATAEPDGDLPANHPYTHHAEAQVSFRPDRPGTAILSGKFEDDGETISNPDRYRRRIDLEFPIAVLERLTDVSMYFGPGSKPTGGWAGLYARTPDHNPIIDQPRSDCYIAAGFSGHGFMHSPAVGKHLAALITGRGKPVVEPDAFGLNRFSEADSGEGLYL
ncbi:MAG: NAD(P)/FAD-dependent oxidoreductase [Salinirussus sp.]